MSDDQKAIINHLRSEGFGYKRIASQTGISVNTIKSYLRKCAVETRISTPIIKQSVPINKETVPITKQNIPLEADTLPITTKSTSINLPKDAPVTKHSVCRLCGKPITQHPGRKEKKFCSDFCRTRWWNSHLHLVKRKAFYNFTCPTCGKPFTVYGNAHRKYCSHACYIMYRFGGAIGNR